MRGRRLFWLGVVSIFTSCLIAALNADGAAPVVSNVRAAQRSGTAYVDISYDLADPDSGSLTVTVAVSTNAAQPGSTPAPASPDRSAVALRLPPASRSPGMPAATCRPTSSPMSVSR